MRTKEELENVITVLTAERDRLPEYSMFGDNNWKSFDGQLYFVKYCLDYDRLPRMEEEDREIESVLEVYEWLSGDNSTDFYEGILEEL